MCAVVGAAVVAADGAVVGASVGVVGVVAAAICC